MVWGAEAAGKAMLNDWVWAKVVSTELRGCGNKTDVVERDSVKTGGVGKTGPGKLKVEAVVENFAGLNGAAAAEKPSGKSEYVDNVGPGGEVVSKRCTSWLGSWKHGNAKYG